MSTFFFSRNARVLTAFFLFVLTLPSSQTARAGTIVVDWQGSGNHETIQAGIDAAISGDVVEVLAGTYSGDGNRDIDFDGKLITVTAVGAVTIDCGGSISEPHRGFVFESGEDTTAVLEGVTIRNGYAASGGGIYCGGSSPTLRDVTIADCSGSTGGALYLGISDVIIENITITNATGTYGGAIHSDNAWFVIRGATIEDCYATAGAGIYLKYGSELNARDVTISRCEVSPTAGYGGGISLPDGVTLVLEDSVIEDCDGGMFGGGISCGSAWASEVSLRSVVIRGCSAQNGGGMSAYMGSYTLEDVTLHDNTALSSGGGLLLQWLELDATRVTLSENLAGLDGGGGVLGSIDTGSVSRFTIVENTAPGGGAGLVLDDVSIDVANCVFVGNNAGGPCACEGAATPGLIHNLSWGNVGGDDLCGSSGGVISDDPVFCAGEYTLHDTSPCLPANNAWGEHLGAHSLGYCAQAVEPTSWGSLKAMFR
jgi:hypothetical protein